LFAANHTRPSATANTPPSLGAARSVDPKLSSLNETNHRERRFLTIWSISGPITLSGTE
jgi:hypothetical protein